MTDLKLCRDKSLVMYVLTKDVQIQDLFIKHTSVGSMGINEIMLQYVGKT